jgi:bifunctional oligoribonuclease and PAP phosphatase NrnA
VSEQLARAADVMSGATDVAMACHVNPDTDALGSMLGLSIALRARGVRTMCSFGNDPLQLPRWARELPGTDALVPPKEFPREPALMVTFDAASLDRLGSLAASAARAGELVWIDHHVSNEGLGTIPIVDPSATSTCELVYRLIVAMGGELPDGAAMCLYAGLVTDTGRFQYQAVRPDTLRLAAELREHPFDHARLARVLYEDNAASYLSLLGTALRRVTLDPEADLAWTYLTQADLAGADVEPGDTDDVIDVVRTARETDVAAVFKQQRDGRFKVSLRSRGNHDVAQVASAFGGGGHRLAAGYTSKHGLAETYERLAAVLRGERAEP